MSDSLLAAEAEAPAVETEAAPEAAPAAATADSAAPTAAATQQTETNVEAGKAEAAPIEVKLPDGVDAPELAEALKSGDPQKAADAFGAWLKQSGEAALAEEQAQIDGWRKTIASDKEIGGQRQSETVSLAKKALVKYGTPELAELLKDARYGDHPELLRFLRRVGESLREDSIHGTSQSPQNDRAPRDHIEAIQRLYTNPRKE